MTEPTFTYTIHIKFHKANNYLSYMKPPIEYNFIIITVSTCPNIYKAISKTKCVLIIAYRPCMNGLNVTRKKFCARACIHTLNCTEFFISPFYTH